MLARLVQAMRVCSCCSAVAVAGRGVDVESLIGFARDAQGISAITNEGIEASQEHLAGGQLARIGRSSAQLALFGEALGLARRRVGITQGDRGTHVATEVEQA